MLRKGKVYFRGDGELLLGNEGVRWGFQSYETAKICENVTSNTDVSANNTECLSDSLMNLAAMLRRTVK